MHEDSHVNNRKKKNNRLEMRFFTARRRCQTTNMTRADGTDPARIAMETEVCVRELDYLSQSSIIMMIHRIMLLESLSLSSIVMREDLFMVLSRDDSKCRT